MSKGLLTTISILAVSFSASAFAAGADTSTAPIPNATAPAASAAGSADTGVIANAPGAPATANTGVAQTQGDTVDNHAAANSGAAQSLSVGAMVFDSSGQSVGTIAQAGAENGQVTIRLPDASMRVLPSTAVNMQNGKLVTNMTTEQLNQLPRG